MKGLRGKRAEKLDTGKIVVGYWNKLGGQKQGVEKKKQNHQRGLEDKVKAIAVQNNEC